MNIESSTFLRWPIYLTDDQSRRVFRFTSGTEKCPRSTNSSPEKYRASPWARIHHRRGRRRPFSDWYLCERGSLTWTIVSLDGTLHVSNDGGGRIPFVKLGLVTGEGLFAVIRRHYSRWFLFSVLAGVIIGNLIEAAADIGGMSAALSLLIPLPITAIVVIVGLVILSLQIWGSYTLIRNIFRVLALALLAYVGSAVLAHPEAGAVLRGSFIPTIRFDKNFLSMIVAVIGTSLSAYLYTWQSNEEVEEKIAAGKRRLWQRKGTSRSELNQSILDVTFGMFFSNVVMYFIILSTAATLFKAGKTDIKTAAEAAEALRPLAGNAAGLCLRWA
jgi:Mn2+/Fe2+ NRAMP family transporter